MSLTFDQAVDNLQVIFPTWERDSLSTILITNHGHVERSIETIFQMQEQEQEQASIPSNKSNLEKLTSHNDDFSFRDSYAMTDSNFNELNPSFVTRPSRPVTGNHHPNTNSGPTGISSSIQKGASVYESKSGNVSYRGKRCQLPDDFLRSPVYHHQEFLLHDEQIALALQDEIYRNENPTIGFDNHPRNFTRSEQEAIQCQTSHGYLQNSREADLARNKSNATSRRLIEQFSSMGAAARRNLTQISYRFTNRGRSQRAVEERALVMKYNDDGDSDEDEDEKEVINFSSSSPKRNIGISAPREHVLNSTGGVYKDSNL